MAAPPQGYPPAGTPPPAYGTPPYGQPPAGYGQPAYGQAPPAYGQPAPAWGQPQQPTYAPQPMMPQAPPRPPKPQGYKHKKRMIAAVLLIIGAVMLIVSIVTPMVSNTESGGGTTISIQLIPGSDYSTSCSGSDCAADETGSHAYSATDLTNTGNLYGDIYGLLVGGLVVAFIAGIMLLIGALGYMPIRFMFIVTILLVLVALGLALGGTLAALGTPGALNADSACTGESGTTYCNSFAGSTCPSGTPSGESCNWGPGVGFYTGIVGGVLMLVAFLFLFMSRRDPYTTAEVGTAFAAGQLQHDGSGPAPVAPMVAAPGVAPAAAAPAWGAAPAAAQPAWSAAPAAAAPAAAQPAYAAAPAAAAAPVAAAAPAAAAGSPPACRGCGKPTTWIPQYSRYYCNSCAQYV